MPRPLPGGRSTCVGNTSRSGELKVPTYAIRGPAAAAVSAHVTDSARGAAAATATTVFKNERRERSVGIMIKTAFLSR